VKTSQTLLSRPLRTVPRFADTALRVATALLMTFAAALVLVHAQIYSGGPPLPTTSIWTNAAANTADHR
jgi:hypothetical protein